MKILQKIFSVILLLIFTTISTGVTNAISSVNVTNDYNYENILKNKIIISKQKLAQIPKGNKYIKIIDRILKKIDTKKLYELNKKVVTIKNDIYYKKVNGKKVNKLSDVLINYLDAKIDLELYYINQKKIETSANRVEIELSEMKNPNLSKADKKKVGEKLVNIQLNLLNSANSNFKSILSNFDKLTNYEEIGNLKMKFNLDHELVGKIKSGIELQNYKTKASGFDSQFSGKLKALVEASIKGEKEFKLEFSTFMDFISKDGNMYVLLNKLNIINESNDKKIKEAFNTLKEIALKNKYIKFENKNTKQFLKTLKSINPSEIFTDSKAILEKPLFTAYKKEADKYYLIPTKYACDKFKELSAKFDPWNGNTCSNSQYERMLEELTNLGKLYIEIGKENKLGFDAYPKNDIESFNSYIIFTDKNITEIHSTLVAKKAGEGFELNYIKNNKLAFYLNAGDNINIDFKSELTNNNKFKYIDFVYNAKGYRDVFNAKLKLENKKLNGGFEYNYSSYAGYDYQTYKSKYSKQNLSMSLSGKQNYNNELQNIEISLNGKNLDTNEKTINAKLTKNSDNYSINIENYNKGKIQFKTNLKLQNKNILGTITINDNSGKEYLLITSTGKYDNKYLDINNKVEFTESLTKQFTGNKHLNKKSQANVNIEINTKYNKDNFNFYIDYIEGAKKILEIEIDNKGKINYKKVEIRTPTNTMEMNEALNIKY